MKCSKCGDIRAHLLKIRSNIKKRDEYICFKCFYSLSRDDLWLRVKRAIKTKIMYCIENLKLKTKKLQRGIKHKMEIYKDKIKHKIWRFKMKRIRKTWDEKFRGHLIDAIELYLKNLDPNEIEFKSDVGKENFLKMKKDNDFFVEAVAISVYLEEYFKGFIDAWLCLKKKDK
jgi:hypothetical protein